MDRQVEFSDSESVVDGVLVLQITGEVDLGAATRFDRRLRSALDRSDRVVVDLTPVTFFDSSGLKCLDQAQEHARSTSRSLALVCPPGGNTLRVFELTDLLDHFSIHPSVADAVGSIPLHD